jgi:hypothetical protein
MAQASKTVFLRGDGQYKEGKAAGAIMPGHFLRRTAVADQFATVNAVGADVPPMVALEYDIIGRDLDKPYALNEQVLAVLPERGAEIYALLAPAAAAIANGDYLETAADGTLKIFAAGKRIARALEAVNNSGGGTPARIRVEIL